MNVVVNISKSTIDKCTESCVTSPLVCYTSPTNPLLNMGKCCRGFVTKALEFLIDCNKSVGNVQEVSVNGEQVTYIFIKNIHETAQFFDTFKKLGINLGTLVVGFTNRYDKIYLPEKLVKDLKRHEGTETLSAMTMYIITLATFCEKIFKRVSKYSVDTYSRTVEIDDTFVASIFDFDEEEYTVDIKGIASESFESICWSKGPYATYEYAGGFGRISCNYNVAKTLSGDEFIAIEYGTASYTNYFQIFESGNVHTNSELCYFELQSDSLTRAIMPRVLKETSILSAPLVGDTWNVIDADEASDWVKTVIADLLLRIDLVEGISKATFKTYGVEIKGSTCDVDPEVIKEKYKDDEYAQQLYMQNQDYYETFDLGTLVSLVPGFAKGDVYAMLFTGESGTGKSTSARVIPYKCGIPYISVNFSVNIEEADLFGSMIPNPTKKDVSDPEFIWQDGIITKAIRNGYCAILEEINFARPGVLGKLNSLLDENRQIDLPTGEIVKAHPNFRMIATCNIAYEGTNRLNKAFINRFEQVVNFENPEMDKLIEIIKSRTGYSKNDNITKVLDVYNAIRKFSTEQNLDLVISVRQLLTIFKQGKYYKTAHEAVKNIIVNGAFIEVPEYADLFKKSVLTAFDLKFKI